MLLLFTIQLIPLVLILWLGLMPLRAPLARTVQALATASVLLASTLAGIWPAWWLPYPSWLLFAAALIAASTQSGGRSGAAGWAGAAALGLLGGYAAILSVQAIAGRTPPPGPVVDLALPLRDGHFRVVHGGFSLTINPHLRTLARATERQRAYYGQSYAVDLVAAGPLGFTARGIEPRAPHRWAIFGAAIHAPCAGTVMQARDGLADNPVPRMDPRHMVGNHVLLRCADVDVLLGHMTPGSVAVAAGDAVRAGDVIGRVGNSGNSSAPHLHIHAQRPGTHDAPLSGEPLPMRFEGRFPVRGKRL